MLHGGDAELCDVDLVGRKLERERLVEGRRVALPRHVRLLRLDDASLLDKAHLQVHICG